MEIPLSSLGALLAHLLYALIGVAVLVLGPRVPANRAFALFSVGSGLAGVVGRLVEPLGIVAMVAEPLEAALWALGALGVVALAADFPDKPGRHDRAQTRLAFAFGGVLIALLVASWSRDDWVDLHPAVVAFSLLMAASSASAVLLAARAFRPRRDVTPYAAMALAVFAPTAIATGAWIGAGTSGRYGFMALFSALCLGAVAAAWLLVAVRAPARRWPIAVCWMAIGAALAGQVSTLGGGGSFVAWESTIVVVRLVAVAPLAFLIVRGQLPGIETKVRWTLSRGTVAAGFVAVFFVASEGAQILFGQGNEWLGLFAAGALVFAIAPLQRAAERLAEKAVPVAAPGGVDASAGAFSGETSFRKAVRLALRDTRLTRAEEGDLHELARDLGLDGAIAHAIIAEVEREVSP